MNADKAQIDALNHIWERLMRDPRTNVIPFADHPVTIARKAVDEASRELRDGPEAA